MSIGSGVFDPWGSKNRGFPLTRRVALTTVLHYRADCDKVIDLMEDQQEDDGLMTYWTDGAVQLA